MVPHQLLGTNCKRSDWTGAASKGVHQERQQVFRDICEISRVRQGPRGTRQRILVRSAFLDRRAQRCCVLLTHPLRKAPSVLFALTVVTPNAAASHPPWWLWHRFCPRKISILDASCMSCLHICALATVLSNSVTLSGHHYLCLSPVAQVANALKSVTTPQTFYTLLACARLESLKPACCLWNSHLPSPACCSWAFPICLLRALNWQTPDNAMSQSFGVPHGGPFVNNGASNPWFPP